jgi:folylpolyglutamate synthase/dihydropteroate synthase
MLVDKNWKSFLEIIAPIAEQVVCVPVSSERTLGPSHLAEESRRYCAHVFEAKSLQEGLGIVKAAPFVVITGSFYLIGEALEAMGLVETLGERGLNEWTISKL